MERTQGKYSRTLAKSALLALTLVTSRSVVNTSVVHAEGLGNPTPNIITSSSDTKSYATQEVVYVEKVPQIRTIDDWSTYDYIGSPTISRDVYIQVYENMGSPLAKYAGAMYDESVRMGLDPGYYLTVSINETSLRPNSHMNPCNIRYASSVLPPGTQVPHINGFADFSQATVDGKPVTEEQAYVLATQACAANLHVQHDKLEAKGGSKNIYERTLYEETPPTDGNNTEAYIAYMKMLMRKYNRLSLAQMPPIPHDRRLILAVQDIPTSPATPQNVVINQSVTPLPQNFAANIAA